MSMKQDEVVTEVSKNLREHYYSQLFGVSAEDKAKAVYNNELSQHELFDRTYLQLDMWEAFVLGHPVTVLDNELFNEAYKIHQTLINFHNKLQGSST